MATVYVSYRSSEEPYVAEVVRRLQARHEISIDLDMPVGVDWRSYQLAELRRSEVFLVFLSRDTAASSFQNAEIGAARFCSAYVDGKLIVPVLLDAHDPPPSIKDLDHLDLTDRDPVRAAKEIDQAIARRLSRVRLFISHSHRDEDIAARLVDVIEARFEVPVGELRCTSVPGYQLDLGTMAPDVLRRELGSAVCVAAILTPASLASEWVLFELGAVWSSAKTAMPLLAGGLEDKDVPGPLRGAAGGQLASPLTVDRLLDQLQRELRWRTRPDLRAGQKREDLVKHVAAKSFARDPLEEELRARFAAKLARIGNTQTRLLHYISHRLGTRAYIPFDELSQQFGNAEGSVADRANSALYYRLEQLRLLGFLQRVAAGEVNGLPVYAWTLSDQYRREVGI